MKMETLLWWVFAIKLICRFVHCLTVESRIEYREAEEDKVVKQMHS